MTLRQRLLLYLRRVKGLPRKAAAARLQQFLNYRVAVGQLSSSLRRIDLSFPTSWEFSAFSQNGEDGILDVLSRHLRQPNRRFVEIGSGDGTCNCTAFLAFVLQYSGLMVEADETQFSRLDKLVKSRSMWVDAVQLYVTVDNVHEVVRSVACPDPDVFAVDIDGMDYHIVQKVLQLGCRPKVFLVEYNSAFGPDMAVTVPYSPQFDHHLVHPSHLYYGASLGAWRCLLAEFGYRFLSVESHGVNAFFVHTQAFDQEFVESAKGLGFAENLFQSRVHGALWPEQFEKIKDMPLEVVE